MYATSVRPTDLPGPKKSLKPLLLFSNIPKRSFFLVLINSSSLSCTFYISTYLNWIYDIHSHVFLIQLLLTWPLNVCAYFKMLLSYLIYGNYMAFITCVKCSILARLLYYLLLLLLYLYLIAPLYIPIICITYMSHLLNNAPFRILNKFPRKSNFREYLILI